MRVAKRAGLRQRLPAIWRDLFLLAGASGNLEEAERCAQEALKAGGRDDPGLPALAREVVDVGLVHFYRVPVTLVAFLAFLAGMLSMLLLSLRHDRRLREELRARGLLEPARPEPARPAAASAWGVVRDPAPGDDEDRTIAYPRYDEGPAA